jgi:hypothetical protein
MFEKRRWQRIVRWIWALTLAAIAGTLLAGAGHETALDILGIGALLSFVPNRFLNQSIFNERRKDR